MSNRATVRPFQTKDASSVVQLWRDVFPGHSPGNDPHAALCRKAAQADDLVFVAEHGGNIVGAVMAGYDGVRGWIYALAVIPASRHQGIGRELLSVAESALRERGCPKVNLQIRSSAAEAEEFYAKCGYGKEARASFGKRLAPEEFPCEPLPTIDVSDRIRLTPVTLSDRQALLTHLNQTQSFGKQTESIPYPYTEFHADSWLSSLPYQSIARTGQALWAIRDHDQAMIGCVGFKDFVLEHKAEIGYWLAQPYWGQGLATQVVRSLCAYAFEHYQLRRIQARVFGSNQASANVLMKAGFEQEGRCREQLLKEGRLDDVLIFALLRDEHRLEHKINEIDDWATQAEAQFLSDQLEQFNASQTGRECAEPLCLVIRDDRGKIQAGLRGTMALGWLHIGALWVRTDRRSEGLGTKLLQAAETKAKQKNCVGVCLSSFDFQAPAFYEKQGYQVVGKIEDYPRDGKLQLFVKRF